MAASMASVLLLCLSVISSLQFVSSSSVCSLQSQRFLNNLQSQCSLEISFSSPTEVDGETLDKALSSRQRNAYTSVLLYASWCPFSQGTRSTFDVLSSMFPEIRHLAVEQSSAMPSVFSKYGIHSLPSILVFNQTARVRYFGPKDLSSLTHFYKRVTGLEPVDYVAKDEPNVGAESLMPPWRGSSLKEIFFREPYLVFSVLFLCLRVFLYFFPDMLSRFEAFWVSYVPDLNLGIFGGTSQLVGRVLHVIDMKRLWNKLKLYKTRNFQRGAKNARVWASSLASVSLGETSLARTPSGDS